MPSELDLTINGGLVVTPAGRANVNIGVAHERIQTLSLEPLEARESIDATGKVVLPGAIDPHVHFRMYQREVVTSDDYASGSISAACGGVTTYIDFAVQPSGASAVTAFKERLDEARSVSAIDFAFHSALTTPTDETLAEISELVALGVRSFKFFMTYRKFQFYTDLGFLLEAMREIARLDAVALIHAENDEILEHLKDQFLADGKTGIEYLALHRPDYAEEIAISDTATLARETGCEVSVVHLSSRRGLQAVLRGRNDGARYRAETCPQYLILSHDLLTRSDGALYTFTPTMKGMVDSGALWAGLVNGDVTYVGSDHSPFDRAIKLGAQTFEQIYPGIPGTETLLPLLFSEGVSAGRISLERLADVSSSATARVFQLHGKGGIRLGSDADLVIVDPSKDVLLAREMLHSRCDYTPYAGMRLRGYPILTISRGDVVMRDGDFVGTPGRGGFVDRAPELAVGERVAVPA